jgi:hypothetical protein
MSSCLQKGREMVPCPSTRDCHRQWLVILLTICAGIPTLLHASNGVADPTNGVAGEVTAVTIYSSHARVERTIGVTEGEMGLRSIRIGPLPASIIDASIEVSGSPNLSAVSVQVQRNRGEPVESESTQAKRILLKKRKEQLLALQREDAALKRMRSRFAELLPELDDEHDGSNLMDLTHWAGLLDLVQQGMAGAASSSAKLAPRIREAKNLHQQAREELANLEQIGNRERAMIHVGLQDLSGKGGAIRVRYLIPQATWHPHYEIDVNSSTSSLQIRAFAVVGQATGEDWPEVPVRFSTSTPEQGSGIPELASLVIGRDRYLDQDVLRKEIERYGMRDTPGRELDLGVRLSLDPQETASKLGEINQLKRNQQAWYSDRDFETATIAEGASLASEKKTLRSSRLKLEENLYKSRRYRGQLPSNSNRGFLRIFSSVRPEAIPSDSQQHRLLYSVKNLEFDEERTCVPELSTAVFRRVIASLSGSDPLLSGSVSVFLDEDYLGQAWIETTAPGEDLELNLGVDGQVVVERIQRDSEDEVGLFSKAKIYQTDLHLKVTNFHDEMVQVSIRERIPFTESESLKIRVDRTKSSPLPAGLDSKSGLLSWEVDLAAGITESIQFIWSIEAPLDVELMRREAPERGEEVGR